MKRGADKGSECASCGLKTCICCFWFLEKFIRYLNHNAYTVIGNSKSQFVDRRKMLRPKFNFRFFYFSH